VVGEPRRGVAIPKVSIRRGRRSNLAIEIASQRTFAMTISESIS
jgi:hypothetical protein